MRRNNAHRDSAWRVVGRWPAVGPRRVVGLWRVVGIGAALLALATTAACTGTGTLTPTANGTPAGPTGTPATSAAPQPSSLDVVPAKNAKNVSPAAAVSATVVDGTLTSVSLTGDGKAVKGVYDPTRAGWHNTQQLAYGTTYTLTVTGTGADGRAYRESRAFTTVRPSNLTLPYLRANDGMLLDKGTFGVGQPIDLWFDEPIRDKAAAERSLTVTTDPPGIVGAWYWMNDHEVHWRPQVYWPSGTKVTVVANVYGVNLGNGLYGQANRSATFTIGHSKIAIADSKTHRMKVYIDGKQVTKIGGHDVTAGIPISMGKGGTETTAAGVTVDFTTNSGPHVVTQKFEVIKMRSASFGITDPSDPNYYSVDISKAVQISGDGEFVHLRDWDTYQLGKVNTSHGCVNVGADYIYWFYNQFGAGDIVDVTGTNRHLDVHNGLGDWVLTWDQWLKGSALS
jgi:lipoprotein-anchoring transpeptidase ErfK/SrfK